MQLFCSQAETQWLSIFILMRGSFHPRLGDCWHFFCLPVLCCKSSFPARYFRWDWVTLINPSIVVQKLQAMQTKNTGFQVSLAQFAYKVQVLHYQVQAKDKGIDLISPVFTCGMREFSRKNDHTALMQWCRDSAQGKCGP